MGRVGAFLQVEREAHGVRVAEESARDFEEFALPLELAEQEIQASRCMNCGVAFCQAGVPLGGSRHAVGCPLHNLIPETNDLLCHGRLDDAAARMALTNPFPEFTGRVCPAPCETACNLGLHKEPVTINDNERAISDYAWERGMKPLEWPAPDAPLVSVIGSGPAGLTVAWEMARRGWRVRVYERSDRPGGLLMYGIPNMKLPKWVVERRVNLMRESGIEFVLGVDVCGAASESAGNGADDSVAGAKNNERDTNIKNEDTLASRIAAESDAVVLAIGAGIARDVDLEGRELDGIHFALDYLTEVTSALLDERPCEISAEGKDVVVIGGGDTGNDCVACTLRQGARSVTQVIRAERAPESCDAVTVWPADRGIYSQGYGQREADALFGDDPRVFSMDTIGFSGVAEVERVHIQELSYDGGRHLVEETESDIPAQLVLIAKGFTGTDARVFKAFGVEAPGRGAVDASGHCLNVGNCATNSKTTSADSSAAALANDNASLSAQTPIFVTGDAALGSTLVVTAMADALDCVEEIIAS